ncbi:hypothetical protein ACIGO9_31495 [Nocardia asteroides]|uniref:hypothetical protein n=1 Tax=Nocardia asteroides TaxID=1824 RepID=UPI0037CC94C8
MASPRPVAIGGVHARVRGVHAYGHERNPRAGSGGDRGEQARVVVGAPVGVVLGAVGDPVEEHGRRGGAVVMRSVR